MKLSNAQLRMLKCLKDHNHPYNDPVYRNGLLVVNVDRDTLWPKLFRFDQRTLSKLSGMGFVHIISDWWMDQPDGVRSKYYAVLKITPQGVDAFLAACDTQPALRSL